MNTRITLLKLNKCIHTKYIFNHMYRSQQYHVATCLSKVLCFGVAKSHKLVKRLSGCECNWILRYNYIITM